MAFNIHNIFQDALLTVTTALPAQNATANGNSVELHLGREPEGEEILVSVPATPSLASGQTITLTIQEADDNATFAANPVLNTVVLTSSGSGGAAAAVYFPVPKDMKRYIRLSIAASATAGNNTAISATLSLLPL